MLSERSVSSTHQFPFFCNNKGLSISQLLNADELPAMQTASCDPNNGAFILIVCVTLSGFFCLFLAPDPTRKTSVNGAVKKAFSYRLPSFQVSNVTTSFGFFFNSMTLSFSASFLRSPCSLVNTYL